jgi:nucleoside-diphosphate-sugar epimerase
MKILVIGGTRFFGYHIVRKLLGDGHEVILFNRGLTPDDFGDRVKRIQGDRNEYQSFYRVLKGDSYDVVVDMIAFKAEDSQAAVRTFQGRVGHLIHISTGSIYIVTKDFPCPLREEDYARELYPQPKKDADWWLYGYHKRKCEEVLREAYEKQGFPVTMLRLPIVMGERDYTLRAYSYFLRIEDGRPMILPDSGLNVFTHIYQGDIVKTIASNLLNKTSFGQAYNLAQEEILTLRNFILKAAEILGKKVELVDIPTKILVSTSLGTSFSPYSMRRPFILSVEKAKRDLAFSSTPFELWLRKTILWFKNEYKGGQPENYRSRAKEVEIIQKYQRAVISIE